MTTRSLSTPIPTATTDPFPPSLSDFVRRFVTRSRQLTLIESAGIALSFIFTWTLIWCLFDRLLPTPSWLRASLLIIEAAASVVVLIRPLRRLLNHDIPWQRAAAAIEARDPQFGGALQTALSQLLLPPAQRGSPSMLAHVLEQTTAKTSATDPRSLLPAARAFRPTFIAATAFLLILSFFACAWLDFPRLLKRNLLPFSNAAPVTTTRLYVDPGAATVIEGDPLKIIVHTERLGDSQPVLQWRGDDPLFSSALMQPQTDGFSYTFPSIDRPLTYRVTGGDATSPLYAVRLVARPSVEKLTVAYTYPDWTELPPRPAAPTTGDLEAPAGSTATVSVISTQPLSSATAVVDNTRIDSNPTVDPAVRLLTIPMHSTAPWKIELTNTDGITGHGASGMTVHVLHPHPPQANLELPQNQTDLRLQPRDILTLGYQATDQFALANISAQIAVNALPPIDIPIPLGPNHQSQSGSFDVDLAQLAVNLGDIVAITLTAENRARLHATSTPCRIVISPRSIDLNAQQRLSELHEAARLAKFLVDETTAASKALDDSPPGDDKQTRDEQIAPHLAAADSTTPELTRQLLRALTHSANADLSTALEWMVDDSQRAAAGFESADAAVLVEMRDPLRDRFNRLTGITNELQQSTESFWRGELASQLLAEAQDAQADQSRLNSLSYGFHTEQEPISPPGLPLQRQAPPTNQTEFVSSSQADTLRRSIQLAQSDEKSGCAQLGIDWSAGDVPQQLQSRIDEANNTVHRFGPVDFASAANDWSNATPNSTPGASTGFVARLTIASEAQAVRPNGDFIWARDLELSARAARRIDTVQDIPRDARHDYPTALRALQQVHQLLINRTPPAQLTDPLKAADEARRKMRLWAGDIDATSQPTAAELAQDPDRAALEAAAAQAEQKIQQDARIDRATTLPPEDAAAPLDLPPTPNAPDKGTPSAQPNFTPAELEKLRQSVATARQLERLTAEQRILRKQTAKASDADLHEIAQQQAALTDAIQNARPSELPAAQTPPSQPPPYQQSQNQQPPDQPDTDQPNPDQMNDTPKDSRESAMNAIRSAQEQLMEMPKEIDAAHQAEAHEHQAEQQADEAEHDADNADPQTQSAQQLLAQSARAQADAAKSQASAKQVSPDESANLAASLRHFAPEATPAVDAIDQQLTPALTTMRQTQSDGDHEGNQRATQQATQAVAQVQHLLNDGLQSLLKRDALTTAKFFSDKAAQALAAPHPDRASAIGLQRGASAALEQAWDTALHQAAGQRLARMPSLSSILRLNSSDAPGIPQSALASDPAPAEREWGRLRQQRPEDLSAPSHEIDPPEYQDSLRVYFQDLAHQDAGAKQ